MAKYWLLCLLFICSVYGMPKNEENSAQQPALRDNLDNHVRTNDERKKDFAKRSLDKDSQEDEEEEDEEGGRRSDLGSGGRSEAAMAEPEAGSDSKDNMNLEVNVKVNLPEEELAKADIGVNIEVGTSDPRVPMEGGLDPNDTSTQAKDDRQESLELTTLLDDPATPLTTNSGQETETEDTYPSPLDTTPSSTPQTSASQASSYTSTTNNPSTIGMEYTTTTANDTHSCPTKSATFTCLARKKKRPKVEKSTLPPPPLFVKRATGCADRQLIGESCWRPKSLTRIIGGDNAETNQFPYQVVIGIFIGDKISLCGGSIISPTWILTAGHCLCGIDGEAPYRVKVKYNDPKVTEATGAKVKRYIIHSNYTTLSDPFTVVNDIALIELCSPLDFTLEGVQPICFLKEDVDYTGEATVSGWGRDNGFEDDPMPDNLQYVTLNVLNNAICSILMTSVYADGARKHCTFTRDKDICRGDSGGPLVAEVFPGCYFQIGIASLSTCPYAGNVGPAIFTRVSSYRDWICSTTQLC